MKLTQFTDYALRTLIYLEVNNDGLCTVREIAESFGVSYNHMVKVVHKLSMLGYVNSKKGKGGGLSQAKPAGDINLGTLISQTEPDMHIVECFDADTNTCSITKACKLKGVFAEANHAFLQVLESYTLADVVDNPEELTMIFEPRAR